MTLELLTDWDECSLLPILAVGSGTCDDASCGCRYGYVTAGWGFWHVSLIWNYEL